MRLRPKPEPGSAGLGAACALAARYGLKAASVAGSATGPDAVGAPRHFPSRILTYQGLTAPFSSELPDARNLNYGQIIPRLGDHDR
jgi:hypothetical protein